ncbi:MAG TPA: diaminopimelate decarboxylase [Gammaproteobacteria bacterium]|nr:diaminopimelate decarboxylase [Gammaproteobacteria bacterium]
MPAEFFTYVDGTLHAERVSLKEIAASYGTPCYVYSRAALERRFNAFHQALFGIDHLICYSVKANSNLAVLDVLARLGSGFDIVSAGELERVLAAGGRANRTVFSGVGKTAPEIARALEAGVHCFNVESSAELETIDRIARAVGRRAPISFRVNPDVDARTHPYIATGLSENKFGVPIEEAPGLYHRAVRMEHVEVHGVDCHIGSQQTSLEPFADALDRMLKLVDDLQKKGISISHLNVGGGLGIRYKDESPPAPAEYIAAIRKRLKGRSLKLLIEPGRAIAGNAGALLTRVLYLKSNGEKRFAVTDAGMNDLIRPALYGAWQEVRAVSADDESHGERYDVVGPVCESSDFLAKDRVLGIEPGSLLAILSAGAYGFVMSSNYNTRPRAAEVMVDGERAHLVRRREQTKDLFALESRLPADK